ncbi:hypothetical protein PCE1_004942 [Barthelona sp. PCE]
MIHRFIANNVIPLFSKCVEDTELMETETGYVKRSELSLHEILLLMHLNCPHVVKFYGFDYDDYGLSIHLELLNRKVNDRFQSERVHLTHYSRFFSSNEQLRLQILADLFDVVSYLHLEPFCVNHRDLKPEQFAFTEFSDQGKLKLFDFDFSHTVHSCDILPFLQGGTEHWQDTRAELSVFILDRDIRALGRLILMILMCNEDYLTDMLLDFQQSGSLRNWNVNFAWRRLLNCTVERKKTNAFALRFLANYLIPTLPAPTETTLLYHHDNVLRNVERKIEVINDSFFELLGAQQLYSHFLWYDHHEWSFIESELDFTWYYWSSPTEICFEEFKCSRAHVCVTTRCLEEDDDNYDAECVFISTFHEARHFLCSYVDHDSTEFISDPDYEGTIADFCGGITPPTDVEFDCFRALMIKKKGKCVAMIVFSALYDDDCAVAKYNGSQEEDYTYFLDEASGINCMMLVDPDYWLEKEFRVILVEKFPLSFQFPQRLSTTWDLGIPTVLTLYGNSVSEDIMLEYSRGAVHLIDGNKEYVLERI